MDFDFSWSDIALAFDIPHHKWYQRMYHGQTFVLPKRLYYSKACFTLKEAGRLVITCTWTTSVLPKHVSVQPV